MSIDLDSDDAIAQAIDAMLQGRAVYVALLFFIDFENGPGRFWTGPTKLRTRDGNEWHGSGSIISLDVVSPALGTTAQNANLKISGVDDEFLNNILPNIDVAVERDCVAYAQFFGDGDVADAFVRLGDPIAIGGWVSDQISFDATPDVKTVSLSLESYFVGRSRSPASFFSYNEQRDRSIAMGFDGVTDSDEGGEFMSSLQNKVVTFPY